MTTTKSILDGQLYVGTYAKYNDGSIDGEWLSLSDYSSKEEFLNACLELHNDEEDPELMFQDADGVPDLLYSECSLFDFWSLADELESNNIDDYELYFSFCSHFDYDFKDSFSQFEEAYCGEQSPSDFTYDLVEEMMTSDAPDFLTRYFDYDKFERDLFMTDYTEIDGHIYRNL